MDGGTAEEVAEEDVGRLAGGPAGELRALPQYLGASSFIVVLENGRMKTRVCHPGSWYLSKYIDQWRAPYMWI